MLDTRRSIEQLFAELDSGQSDIERALAEVASGDDAVALDIRLKNLTEFARQGNVRCDQIEQASKTIATLDEVCAELGVRLAPFAAAEDGITSRVRELSEQRDRLAASIDLLERTPEGGLAERVQKLADDRKKLDDDISHLNAQFCKLANLRKDVAGLFAASSAGSIRSRSERARLARPTPMPASTNCRNSSGRRKLSSTTSNAAWSSSSS